MKAWIKSARETLEKNPSILSVGDKQISFTNKFKETAVKAYQKGLSPSEIFANADLDPKLFPESYCSKTIARWAKAIEKHGKNGFHNERRGKGSTGRPRGSKPKKAMTQAQMEARLAYLEAENDFLKKLHALAKQGK